MTNASAPAILNCTMAAEAAALERLLQVVRVRGFRVEEMTVSLTEGQYQVALTLSGVRALDGLVPQIAKLHSVAQVEAAPALAVVQTRKRA